MPETNEQYVNRLYGETPDLPPADLQPEPLLNDYLKALEDPGPPAASAPVGPGPIKEAARVAAEVDPTKGIPAPGAGRPQEALGPIPQMEIPADANAAISAWQDKNIDIRPTPAYAKKVDGWARARAVEFLIREGLMTRGQLSQHLNDDLLEKVVGGFRYVGAGLLADVTEQDAQEAMDLAIDSYANQVLTRAQAKTQEIIANHVDPRSGAGPAGASRNTLDAVGRELVAQQDKIANAAIQIRNRRNEPVVQGAFKSMLVAANTKLRTETRADPEIVDRLKLQAGALAETEPVDQDSLRFILSIQEDPGFLELPPGTADTLTGPGRLMARTAEVFQDIEDPLLAYRQVQQHFDRQINRARALRIGADPDANHVGMLYTQFPQIALDVAETKLRQQITSELGAETLTNPTRFELALRKARNERLEGIAEDMFTRALNLDEELQRVEARESISFITDLETAAKRGVGNLFEALSETGTNFRQAFLQNRKFRRDVAVALTGEAALEAMQYATEVADEYAANRTIAEANPGEVRYVMSADGSGGRRQEVTTKPSVPPPVIPLENDYSNLRAVLISAERAGEMPYSLRRALFSDDPNDMVANAAVLASDVMSPRTVLRMINSGLGLEEVQAAFKQAQRAAFEEKVLPSTPGPDAVVSTRNLQELMDTEQALIQRLGKLNPLERPTKGYADMVALTQTRWERGWKEMAMSFVEDPRTVFDTLAGVAPAVAGAGVAMQPLVTRARTLMANAGLHSRLRRALGDTARFDPVAVHEGRKRVGEVLKTLAEPGGDVAKKMAKRQETYRALADQLDSIAEEAGTVGHAIQGHIPSAKKMDSASRKFRRTLRQLNLREQEDIADAMGLPLQALAMVQSGASPVIDAVSRAARRTAEILNIDGFSVQPWTTRNNVKVANKMVEAVAAGGDVDWLTMPFSLDAAAQKPTIFQRFARAYDALRPGSERIINSSGEYANQVVHFATQRMKDTTAVRHLQAEQVANQVSFTDLMLTKYRNELHDLELSLPESLIEQKRRMNMPFTDEERLIVQAKDKLHERVRRAQRLRGTLDQRRWDTPVALEREQIIEDASDADLILWGQQQAAGGDVHEFWRQNRRVGESFEDFNGRLNRIMAGIDRPDDSIAGLRRSIVRRYLNAPGLSTKQRFDTDSGLPLTPREAARLKSERRSVVSARAKYEELLEAVDNFEVNSEADRTTLASMRRSLASAKKRARFDDPEFHAEVLGENLGLRTEDLKRDYGALVELARTEDALSATERITRLQDMSSGRVSDGIQEVRDLRESLLFNQRALALQNDAFAKRYKNLLPEQQKLFNEVLSKAADTGSMRNLRKLAAEDPKIGRLIDDLDKDAKVLDLLDNTNHFRQNLLRDMRNSGNLTPEEFDTLVGGYAPHLYSSGQHRNLLGAQFDKNIFGTTTEGGLDLSEMLRQKHHKKWKAIVSVQGGRAITHLFDSRADAEKFIKIEYGTRGPWKKVKQRDGSSTPGVVETRSGVDDPIALLEPIGEKRAAQLGFLGEGPSLFARMDTLIRDMTQSHLMKLMDRPGWTLTPEQFKMRTSASADPVDAARTMGQYVALENTRQNGPLQGKYVHVNVAKQIEGMNRALKQTTWIGDQMRQLAEENGVVTKAIVGTTLGLATAARKTKQAIVTNKIARSIQTIFWNFMMDSEMFGVTAAGRDFSILHPRALRNKRRAAQMLFDQLAGKEPSPDLIQAIRDGAIDDSLISHRIDPDFQRTFRQIQFGEVGQLKHLGNESVKFLEGLNMPTFAKAMDALIGGSDDIRILNLRKRYDEIVQAEMDLVDPGDAASLRDERLSIVRLLEKEQATVGNSMRRGMHAINQILVGDKRNGLFNDTELMSREIYGRVSNINRLAAYLHLKEKGFSGKEAVARLNLFMQNYSRVPQALRAIGQSPFGSPIIAFPYEQLRIMKNMLKYRPEAIMGFMGGLAATNFLSMVAGGIDPYRMAAMVRGDTAGFPPWMAFASSLYTPHNDGTWSSLQLPALNWWQAFREPFGIQARIFGVEADGDLMKNLASKFLLGNPVANTVYAGLQGRDPESGLQLGETDSFFGYAARSMLETFIPTEIPFIGSASRQIAEGVEKPAYIRSGREVSVAQRAIQSILGVRLRGALGSTGAAGEIGEGMAKVLGVEAWTDLPVENEAQPGFNDQDVLASLYVASREVDPENAKTERILDNAFLELRKARDLLASDDPDDQKAGTKLREKAMARYEKELKPFADFSGQEFDRARSPQERMNMLVRAYRTQDFDAQFDRLSLSRKVAVVLGATLADVHQDTVKTLIERTMATDYGELRTYTQMRAISDAKKMLQRHLDNPVKGRLLGQLDELMGAVRLWEEEAAEEFQLDLENEMIKQQALEAFYGS